MCTILYVGAVVIRTAIIDVWVIGMSVLPKGEKIVNLRFCRLISSFVFWALELLELSVNWFPILMALVDLKQLGACRRNFVQYLSLCEILQKKYSGVSFVWNQKEAEQHQIESFPRDHARVL